MELRNSIASADYDDRAFYSIIPLQRYWQRRRHRITTSWARGADRMLDIGCGSSVIIQSLNNAIGMDVSMGKLRFLRRLGIPLLRGSAFALPFKDKFRLRDQFASDRAYPVRRSAVRRNVAACCSRAAR